MTLSTELCRHVVWCYQHYSYFVKRCFQRIYTHFFFSRQRHKQRCQHWRFFVMELFHNWSLIFDCALALSWCVFFFICYNTSVFHQLSQKNLCSGVWVAENKHRKNMRTTVTYLLPVQITDSRPTCPLCDHFQWVYGVCGSGEKVSPSELSWGEITTPVRDQDKLQGLIFE